MADCAGSQIKVHSNETDTFRPVRACGDGPVVPVLVHFNVVLLISILSALPEGCETRKSPLLCANAGLARGRRKLIIGFAAIFDQDLKYLPSSDISPIHTLLYHT